MPVTIAKVDFSNAKQRVELAALLRDYSGDPMGGGAPLEPELAAASVELLATKSYATSFLAHCDDSAVGFANCFETLATFAAKPALNIHDIAVASAYRGRGIGHLLLQTIEDHARARGYYKLTLEVLAGNIPAQKTYERFGFKGYELDPRLGQALFWQKIIAGY